MKDLKSILQSVYDGDKKPADAYQEITDGFRSKEITWLIILAAIVASFGVAITMLLAMIKPEF